MHKTEKEIKKINKDLKLFYNEINYIINNRDFKHYGKELFKLNYQESKEHDNFRGNDIKRGITIREESIFFFVQKVISYLYDLEKYIPTAEDYLNTRESIFYAYAISQKFKEELKQVITEKQATYINNLDYCDLI